MLKSFPNKKNQKKIKFYYKIYHFTISKTQNARTYKKRTKRNVRKRFKYKIKKKI